MVAALILFLRYDNLSKSDEGIVSGDKEMERKIAFRILIQMRK